MAVNTTPQLNVMSDMVEIFNSVKEVFPSATIQEVDPSQTNPELKMSFPSTCGTLTVERAVSRKRFLKRMDTLELKVRLGKYIDVSNFNLSNCYAPSGGLTGAAKINQLVAEQNRILAEKERLFAEHIAEQGRILAEKERRIAEEGGEKIEEALSTFLMDPNDSERVRLFGLLPDQIDRNASKKELLLFVRLFENPQQENHLPLFESFCNLYPNLSLSVIRHFSASQAGEENSDNEDVFRAAKERLAKRVIGQPVATKALAATFAEFNHQDGNRVLMFVGPTGVGKTEAAKAVASLIPSATGSSENDSSNPIVFFAMNQYQDEFTVSKLFGSPAGYVGSTSEPGFAIEMNKLNPSTMSGSARGEKHVLVEKAVLLFDEFEKAHSKVKQSLLTLFDEGKALVQYTKYGQNIRLTYHFNKCLFICTSNLFSKYITGAFQAADNINPDTIAGNFIDLNLQFPSENTMSPELLGRMKIIPFGPIPKGPSNYQAVVEIGVKKIFQTFVENDPSIREYEIDNPNQFYQAIEDTIYGEGIDLRKIKRFFKDVKNTITTRKGDWGAGKTKKLQFSAEKDEGKLIPIVRVFRYVTRFKVYDVDIIDSFPMAYDSLEGNGDTS